MVEAGSPVNVRYGFGSPYRVRAALLGSLKIATEFPEEPKKADPPRRFRETAL